MSGRAWHFVLPDKLMKDTIPWKRDSILYCSWQPGAVPRQRPMFLMNVVIFRRFHYSSIGVLPIYSFLKSILSGDRTRNQVNLLLATYYNSLSGTSGTLAIAGSEREWYLV